MHRRPPLPIHCIHSLLYYPQELLVLPRHCRCVHYRPSPQHRHRASLLGFSLGDLEEGAGEGGDGSRSQGGEGGVSRVQSWHEGDMREEGGLVDGNMVTKGSDMAEGGPDVGDLETGIVGGGGGIEGGREGGFDEEVIGGGAGGGRGEGLGAKNDLEDGKGERQEDAIGGLM